jgi:hypothetical protein
MIAQYLSGRCNIDIKNYFNSWLKTPSLVRSLRNKYLDRQPPYTVEELEALRPPDLYTDMELEEYMGCQVGMKDRRPAVR